MDYAHLVTCPRCAAEVRAGQKFCAECGLALTGVCANCGAPHEPNQKFCAECGAALPINNGSDSRPPAFAPAMSPPPSTAERRYVSILFADLVGFTPLAEDQDPEKVRDLLSGYFDVARDVIERYGGTVEKFIGDAVMAVWGAPVAREDDPERAVRAALDLVAAVRAIEFAGSPLAIRAGVLSGEAAVVPGRTGEGMIAGDLVNTASRLQSVAQSGMVLVGESTHKQTSAAIAYEPAGDQLLKGKQAPIPAWRALRVVARVGGGGRDEGLEPPFVGRDEELRLLKDQVHAAERERKLRMMAVTGQAGIGKSRLIWELEKYLDGVADTTYFWHQGRSPAYGEGVAFWALGEMVRRRAGIAEADDESSTRAKLQQSLSSLVTDAQERRWLEPALGALLGIDEADWAAREQLFSAWRTYFERVAERGPAVLAFEDLQWADDGLLDFIEHMLEYARDKPILIVTLARPELLERRPNFGMGHRALMAMHLEPLSGEAMRELVVGLVSGISDDDLTRVIQRAEGVPLYAVEVIRSLLDSGSCVRDGDGCLVVGKLPQLDVPPTLRALISSRLDSLNADDRRLLQDASVIGQSFPVAAVAALTGRGADDVGARLRELAHKELVNMESDPRSPERGQYIFKQSLIREVAYSTLSMRERRALHLAAARYYDTLGDDELAGVLATHYLEAFRAAPEGEEGSAVAAQARIALRAAAERADRLHSYLQATDYYEQAMAVSQDESDLDNLREHAAKAAKSASQFDKALTYLAATIAWSALHDEPDRTLKLMALQGSWLLETSQIDAAFDLLSRAIAEAPQEAGEAHVYLYGQLARAHLFRAQSEQGLAAISRALELAERLGVEQPVLGLLITKTWALGQVGRIREAIALLTGVKVIADRDGDLSARTRSRFNLSSTVLMDDPRYSFEVAREGVEIYEQFGGNAASMAGNAAEAAMLIGDLDEVFRLEERASDVTTIMGAFTSGVAAGAAAFRGDSAAARARIDDLQQVVARSSSDQDQAELRRAKAFVTFGDGRLDETRQLAQEAVGFYPRSSQATESTILAAHAAVLLGDPVALRSDIGFLAKSSYGAAWADRARRGLEASLHALEGRPEEASVQYRNVIDEWRATEMHLDLALTLFERALVMGRHEREVDDGYLEARRILAAMGAESLIDRLLAAAAVQAAGARSTHAAAAATPERQRSAAPAKR